MRQPAFIPRLLLALDRVILQIEAAQPTPRLAQLRKVKARLERQVPARKAVRP